MSGSIAGTARPGAGNPARFIYGLLGFIVVLVLLESYDKEHGSSFVYGYAATSILGILIYQREAIAAGLADLQAAFNAPSKAGSGPAGDNGKARPTTNSGPVTGGKAG